jgi:oxalate decarboxylase
MVDKDKKLVAVENQSRRSFLGAGSAVLAAATLVGLTANAQQREDTRKAEADHSSSDPAQENKPLLAENPNSNTPPPTDHGDVEAIWYSFDLVHKRVEEGGWTQQVTQREFQRRGISRGSTCGSRLEAIASCIGTRPMSGPTCCTEMPA